MRVAINGFGRIGRSVFRILDKRDDAELIAINDVFDHDALRYLLNYDTVMGRFAGTLRLEGDELITSHARIRMLRERDPLKLPWRDLDIDVVIESTGIFTSREQLGKHLEAGAKRVVLTVPAKDAIDYTVVLGVNDDGLKPEHRIISNASCTTNCLAPLAKVLHDSFGIVEGRHQYGARLYQRSAPCRRAPLGLAAQPRRGGEYHSDFHRGGEGGGRGLAPAERPAGRYRRACAGARWFRSRFVRRTRKTRKHRGRSCRDKIRRRLETNERYFAAHGNARRFIGRDRQFALVNFRPGIYQRHRRQISKMPELVRQRMGLFQSRLRFAGSDRAVGISGPPGAEGYRSVSDRRVLPKCCIVSVS